MSAHGKSLRTGSAAGAIVAHTSRVAPMVGVVARVCRTAVAGVGAAAMAAGPTAGCAAAFAAALTFASPAAAAAQEIAIVGGTVHPVSGPAIEGGTVLIRGGEIVAVGRQVEVPASARRIDATGKVVTPGLFDAATSLGLVEVSAVDGTVDYRMEDDPVTAAFDVVDGLNPRSSLIPINRLGGVTTAVSRPTGGLIAGQAAVIDLAGESMSELLVRPRAAMFATYGNGRGIGARGAASLRLREVFEDARFWLENRTEFDRGDARPLSQSRLDLEALVPVLRGEMPLVVAVDRASDIMAVLRIASEYGIRPVILGGAEAWIVREELAESGTPVILKPLTNLPDGFDELGARFDNAALLAGAGVPVALSAFETHNSRWLTQEAGNAVRFGLPWEEALRAVTLAPAVIFGVEEDYGSIEPGKVANVVVWSGDPFEVSTFAETVLIGGEVMPEWSRQRELLERYRTLDGDLPPAYTGGEAAATTP